LFSSTLETQARDDGERVAETFVTMGVERVITPMMRQFWVDPEAVVYSERQLLLIGSANRVAELDSLRLYGISGEALWSSIGPPTALTADELALHNKALRDRTPVSTIVQVEGRPVLSVFVPVTYGDAFGQPFGVANVQLPYAATESLLRDAVVLMSSLIMVALLLAWLLLYRTVHRASTVLRAQARENEHLALHDPLTGLPNRRLLSDRLERAIAIANRRNEPVALLILDVDRFKEINDTLGHNRGDTLLVEIAARLCKVVRDADTVARLGGDEFAILAPTIASLLDADRLARRIHAVFDEPFMIDELALHVDCSVGLAVLPHHAADVTELFQRADIAMYGAKTAHVGVLVYDADSDDSSTDWLLLGDLRVALGTDQLSVHYQPKIDLVSGDVVGLEALLRWNHPQRGNIPPNLFIPVAERSGLIRTLTRYVLEMVLTQVAEWDRVEAQFAYLPVAVNLSARNLVESDFAEFVEDLLASHMVEPHRLELELTESALIEDPTRTHQMLHRLSELGVTLAVDDFGTGYTSMATLESMPLTTLKIDRSFVVRMSDDPAGVTLVRAMVELAHEFGLAVVAEGVEDEDVTDQLRALGCDVGQGFLWSRPVSGDDLPEVLVQLSFRRPEKEASLR
ncbi:MAG TPA: EAL domain-containing protein, partial [Actinomycetes bacterium]|nr:EAL domain-containing protein [Actinomycetes bacterium]